MGSIHFFLNFWTFDSRSNHTGKTIIVRCSKDRLERSLYDFEQNHNTLTYIGHNAIEI